MQEMNPGCVPDSPYNFELTPAWKAFFETFPKPELHVHLLGTIQEATFMDLVRESNAPITEETVRSFYIRGEKPVGVLHIFRTLEKEILKFPSMLTRIAYEHLETAAAQGVHYTEIFWNWTGLKHAMGYQEAQDAILEGFDRAEKNFGIIARLIPAIDREAAPEEAVDLVENMCAHRDPKVIGLGIDYRETGFPPEKFWKPYRMAREAGFHITAHAGEFGEHWRNVETAMVLLQADRIDHGYTIVDNYELCHLAREADIPFAVVPTNSYYLRTIARDRWALDHPIREMVKFGLRVFPNSDDPTMHKVRVSESWRLMMTAFGFSLNDLRGFLMNAIDACFVDQPTKSRWKVEWGEEFDRLSAPLKQE